MVMRLYKSQHGMRRVSHLYQHPPLSIHTPGAAADLFHQLKSPLVDPEVGKAEDPIRIQYANQVDMHKIETLYHHLRPHQNIDPLLLELLYKTVMRRLAPDAVDIHTGNTRLGENLFQVFL